MQSHVNEKYKVKTENFLWAAGIQFGVQVPLEVHKEV